MIRNVVFKRIESWSSSEGSLNRELYYKKENTEIKSSDVADNSNLSNSFSGGILEAFSCFVTFTHLYINMSVTSFSDVFHINVSFYDK